MAVNPETLVFMEDQLAGVGPIAIRRMFGGAGVFLDGVMFALIAEDVLYFKVDEETLTAFQGEGSEAFSYETKNGPQTIASFWRAPEGLFDDRDEMTAWARAAVGAALRADKSRQVAAGRRVRKASLARRPGKIVPQRQ